MMMMMCAISSIEVLHSSASKSYGLLVPVVDLHCTCVAGRSLSEAKIQGSQ